LNVIKYDILNKIFAFNISYLYICDMNSIDLQDLYGKSNHEIAAELGARFRAYRVALRLTRKEVAEKAGISIITIARFESGQSSAISLPYYIALLRTIGHLERILDSIPDLPDSLYRKSRTMQRVRRKKDEE